MRFISSFSGVSTGFLLEAGSFLDELFLKGFYLLLFSCITVLAGL